VFPLPYQRLIIALLFYQQRGALFPHSPSPLAGAELLFFSPRRKKPCGRDCPPPPSSACFRRVLFGFLRRQAWISISLDPRLFFFWKKASILPSRSALWTDPTFFLTWLLLFSSTFCTLFFPRTRLPSCYLAGEEGSSFFSSREGKYPLAFSAFFPLEDVHRFRRLCFRQTLGHSGDVLSTPLPLVRLVTRPVPPQSSSPTSSAPERLHVPFLLPFFLAEIKTLSLFAPDSLP